VRVLLVDRLWVLAQHLKNNFHCRRRITVGSGRRVFESDSVRGSMVKGRRSDQRTVVDFVGMGVLVAVVLSRDALLQEDKNDVSLSHGNGKLDEILRFR
jgi:hypothetical protein